MELGLAGKVALVTGGAGGIGRAIVRALRDEGVRVAVLDASREAVDAMVGPDGGHLHLVADASVETEVRGAVRRVESELAPIDLLVNALGIPDAGDFDTLDAARWERGVAWFRRGEFNRLKLANKAIARYEAETLIE